MSWLAVPPESWLVWLLLYALAIWGLSTVASLLERWLKAGGWRERARWIEFVVPLILAVLIGARLRSWWWVAGPPAAIVVTTMLYPTLAVLANPPEARREAWTGLLLAALLTFMHAGAAALAAAVGVTWGQIVGE
jgi:hypothetical protein